MASSSSNKLYVNLLHTGLSQGSLVLHGVTRIGVKEAFLMLETWWILDVFQTGVGMLIFMNCFHSLCLLMLACFQMWHLTWS